MVTYPFPFEKPATGMAEARYGDLCIRPPRRYGLRGATVGSTINTVHIHDPSYGTGGTVQYSTVPTFSLPSFMPLAGVAMPLTQERSETH